MKVFTIEQAQQWLMSYNLPDIADSRKAWAEWPSLGLSELLPQRMTALARHVADICSLPALLWIDEWGIWQDIPLLFQLVRAGLGENRELFEAPAHLIETDDVEVLVSLLAIIFYFGWDAFLYEPNMRIWHISHDEFIDFHAPLGTLTDEVLELQRHLELQLYKR